MKILLILLTLVVNTSSFAGLPEMMKIYNNPKSAMKIPKCKSNINCNAFVALLKQWQAIPNNYRYNGFDIKKQAKEENAYGFNKGYYIYQNKSQAFIESADIFYDGTNANEGIFAKGYAVILYIEDKNGWVK